MDQVKHIRLSGHTDAFALTAAAHARLLRYLADARLALHADPDGDETVRDLEATIGEHLGHILDTPVDDTRMSRTLAGIGTVEHQQPVNSLLVDQPQGGPWCRIDEGKWFGGICAGIAARGDLRLDWVRTIAILLLLVTAGLAGLVYLALILFLPHVATVEEYRRLRSAGRSVT
jgi:phage shock protein PspC (stress-responsive transcriptional regulator)